MRFIIRYLTRILRSSFVTPDRAASNIPPRPTARRRSIVLVDIGQGSSRRFIYGVSGDRH